MDVSALSGPRLILPRWRTLAQTPPHELTSSKRRDHVGAYKKLTVSEELFAWRQGQSLANAAELIEAAIVSGELSAASQAALYVLKRAQLAQPILVSSARFVLGQSMIGPAMVIDPWMRDEALRSKVGQLKKGMIDNPRDAITLTELARLYFLLGQRKKSVTAMERAIKGAPNSRFVLRSATQLFVMMNSSDRALATIWRSDAVRSDPWVQAAEVAVADACNLSPKFGTASLPLLLQEGSTDVRFSELAVGLASLEYKNGTKRSRIRKLLKSSLARPTENALAQILWVQEEADIEVEAASRIDGVQSADEAAAKIAYDKGDYQASKLSAYRWFTDQPFSLDAARDFIFTSGVLRGDYKSAVDVGNVALRLHPNEHSLINAQMYAAAMAGNLPLADQLIARLDAYRHNEEVVPFILAGRGLLAFRRGDVELGRKEYNAAIEFATKRKRHELVVNAVFYWLEQEAMARSSTEEDLELAVSEIDVQLGKMPKQLQRDLGHTRAVKKQSIRGSFDQLELIHSGEMTSIKSNRPVRFSIPAKHLPKHIKF